MAIRILPHVTVDTAGVHRVDYVVTRVNDRIDPSGSPADSVPEGPRLEAV